MRHLRGLVLPVLTLLLTTVLLAVANWPPLVRNPLFGALEDRLSTLITSSLATVTPLQPKDRPRWKCPAPRVLLALTPTELVRLWQTGRRLPDDAFSVLANTPGEYQWVSMEHQRWLLAASTDAVVALGVDAVVDASCADGLRATPSGRDTALALRRAGILRAVIFDGGHHLAALHLEPEAAILPVLRVRGVDYACHVHLRDAVSVPALMKAAATAGLRTEFFTFAPAAHDGQDQASHGGAAHQGAGRLRARDGGKQPGGGRARQSRAGVRPCRSVVGA